MYSRRIDSTPAAMHFHGSLRESPEAFRSLSPSLLPLLPAVREAAACACVMRVRVCVASLPRLPWWISETTRQDGLVSSLAFSLTHTCLPETGCRATQKETGSKTQSLRRIFHQEIPAEKQRRSDALSLSQSFNRFSDRTSLSLSMSRF